MKGKSMKRLGFENTDIQKGFWYQKQKMVRENTVYAVYNRFAETHRFDALNCDDNQTDYEPHIYWDSDVAKWVEGVAYLIKKEPNEELEKIVDGIIDLIVKNSDQNGYFNSYYLAGKSEERFTRRWNHELYCAGHLIEAAVAYFEVTGKDKFLKAMCKFADYIEKVFKTEKSAAFITPGHPELELALVRLYRTTGEKRYLELSKYFIDEHGKYDETATYNDRYERIYNQDEMLLADRTTADGHCVRALYLFTGVADIVKYYNDKPLIDACKRFFENIVNKRMYITGGVGSTHMGEAFTVDYDLPNRTAYTETCAAISLAMFCAKMQELELNSAYADTVERVIYNGFLSGVSMDGKSFFYENPLEIDPIFNNVNICTKEKQHFPITQRKEVFSCSCCPPNIVRFIPKIAEYMYTYDDDTLYVHQYINSKTQGDGFAVEQETDYPSNGKIIINCKGNKKYLALRIPYWCKNFKINAEYTMKSGYAVISLENTNQVVLELDMPIVFVSSNRRVHENAGRVAVMRGPIVYCAEGVDNGNDLKSVYIDTNIAPTVCDKEFLVPSIKLSGFMPCENRALYFTDENFTETSLKLIPYYAFANRGESEMVVWLLRKV